MVSLVEKLAFLQQCGFQYNHAKHKDVRFLLVVECEIAVVHEVHDFRGNMNVILFLAHQQNVVLL